MPAIVQTHSGRMIDLVNPDPYHININDIAHALANLCRFGGHTKDFYSVAQHCLLCSMNIDDEEHRLTALLHDTTEAYCQDIVAPLKTWLPAYRDIERGLWEVIAKKYGVPVELPEAVKEVDLRMLATEKRDLMHIDIHWACIPSHIEPYDTRVTPMSPIAARATFLKQFHYLKGRQRNGKK